MPRNTADEIPGYFAKCVQWLPVHLTFFDELEEKIRLKHGSDLTSDREDMDKLTDQVAGTICVFITPYFATLSEKFVTMAATTVTQAFPKLRSPYRSNQMAALSKRITSQFRDLRYTYKRGIGGRRKKVRTASDYSNMGTTLNLLLSLRKALFDNGLDEDIATEIVLTLHAEHQFGQQENKERQDELAWNLAAQALEHYFSQAVFHIVNSRTLNVQGKPEKS